MITNNKNENRRNTVTVRLKDWENEVLEHNASMLNISKSDYFRNMLLDKEIVNHVHIVADVDSLQKLVAEYGKIGSNLNQIARYYNSGGSRSRAIDDEIHQCIADLYALRNDVICMAAAFDGSH